MYIADSEFVSTYVDLPFTATTPPAHTIEDFIERSLDAIPIAIANRDVAQLAEIISAVIQSLMEADNEAIKLILFDALKQLWKRLVAFGQRSQLLYALMNTFDPSDRYNSTTILDINQFLRSLFSDVDNAKNRIAYLWPILRNSTFYIN